MVTNSFLGRAESRRIIGDVYRAGTVTRLAVCIHPPPSVCLVGGSIGGRGGLTAYAAVAALARGAGAGLPSAVILGVLAAGGTASDGSLLIAAFAGVSGLLGPFVGAYVDRLEHPKRGYLVAAVVLMLYAALLAIGLGSWPAGVLVVMAGCAGLAQPMFFGALSAQLPRIAPGSPPARAYAVDVGTYNVADIAGPAIVGLAYIIDTSVPGASSLEVVSVMYVLAIVALLLVRIPPRSYTHQEPPPSFAASLRYLSVFWHSVSLRRSTIISTFAFIGIAGVVVAAPLLGADLAGDSGTGALLLAVVATGALSGSVVMARRPMRMGPGTSVVVSTAALGVAIALLAFSPSMWWAFIAAFIVGTTEAPQLSAVMQVRDRESPKHARALVFMAATSAKTAAFALGSLIAAALVTLGWRELLAGAAIIEFVAVALGLLIAGRRMPSARQTPIVGEKDIN